MGSNVASANQSGDPLLVILYLLRGSQGLQFQNCQQEQEATHPSPTMHPPINEARRLMLEVSDTLGSSEIVSSTHAPKSYSPHDEHERELDEWSVRNQMQSLRLLHHYFSSAYRLLSYETATAELWRTTVPEIALTHEYLMHGILALSALHYAHTNSTQREDHLVISARYQQLALKFFSGNIGAVDDGNCEAYFLLSSIIFLLSTFRIAHSGDSGERPSPETVAQSFVLLQGIKGVLASQSLQRWVVGNPLAVLLSPRPYDQSRHELNSQLQDRICRVRQLAEEDSGFYNDEELRSNYIDAIDLLQITSTWVDPSSSEGRRRVWYWPFNLSQAFLHSLRTRQPLALIVLSIFAQLVSSLEAENWLLDGWSNSVLGMIDETLDRQWRHWLGWSQEQ
ncbi:hypothetical protein PFICI_04867 [Pestalotiopsis fici W106-1]|uniref:Transcription factor domain-containing protein n=1 Tax=Pestalotiopsis fici (strain W106-1 / CGMCC3.15140) TaxID=1229662 RepID=W3XCT3_PESFW|nr:uncharacterized protein PFICI_04867 [Pestalotiopsis fici W106-1]ETS82991.1 hypothetical protein PFICI_04867 [Pestalotiopsis fici W106-1]